MSTPSVNKQKKYILSSLLALFLVFAFAPTAQAGAREAVGNFLAGGMGGIIGMIATAVIVILTPLLGLIVFIGAKLFDWLINMTGAFAGSDVVAEAWAFLRDLANISFIFILLIIAISMILRIGRYSDTKLIFRLIVVALLINFSRIIALAIVDFSQVLTDFFTQEATTGGFFSNNIMSAVRAGKIWEVSGGFDVGSGGAAFLSTITVSAIMNIVLMAGIAIFFALGVLLLGVRLIALTLLVVAAPLAFVAYILPDFKDKFSQWWKELIKYSIFAPALTFFMWLAITFSNNMDSILNKSNTKAPSLDAVSSSILAGGDALLVYLITLGFLYFGLYASQMMGIQGGAKVVGLANKARGKAIGWGKKWGYQVPGRKVKEKFAQGVSGQKMKLFGKEIGGAGYWAGKGLEGVGKAGAAARKVHKTAPWYAKPATALVGVAAGGAAARAAHLPIIAKQKLQAENKKILDQYKDWDDHDIEAQIKAGTIPSKHAAILATEKLAPKGKAMKIGEDKVQELIKIMITNHMNVNNVLKNDPTLVDRLSSELKEKLAKSLGKTVSELTSKSILEKMKANELSWLSGETINTMKDDIQELIVQGAITHNHLSKLYASDNTESINAVAEIIREIEGQLDDANKEQPPKKTIQWIRGPAQTVIQEPTTTNE